MFVPGKYSHIFYLFISSSNICYDNYMKSMKWLMYIVSEQNGEYSSMKKVPGLI